MHILIESQMVDFCTHTYYGGMEDGLACEDLYETPSGEWVLHTWRREINEKHTLLPVSEADAVRWVIELRQSKERVGAHGIGRRARRSVPINVVPYQDQHECGRVMYGNHHEWILPDGSRTARQIEERQTLFLEPGKVLEVIMRPQAAEITFTASFRQERHDSLLARLQAKLEATLPAKPHISLIQSLQDHGCDLIIDWPMRAKYGVQLKSNGDVEDRGFAGNTVQQIQDSHQHGLTKLYVVFAADITGTSNREKVRGLISRISAMNDAYVVVVQPENAWTLLFPTQ